ncbi:MAG: chromosomal replication initiator protein DnaA [Oligoflexia bacterium]|nr:chromosomal replication initiator protein DnaA [Oligoflexia bacterium]
MEEAVVQGTGHAFLDVWQKGVSALQSELDPQIYIAYIKPLKVQSVDASSGEVVITAPSRLVCNHVDREFKSRLSSFIAKEMGISSIRLRFSVVESSPESAGKPSPIVIKKVKLPTQRQEAEANAAISPEGARLSGINPKYTFDTFVVGSSNQFCHAAAMRVAERPGLSYNPFFIYGGVGLGKTHLLHAIGNAVLARNPKARVLYMSSEGFTNELIQALRHGTMNEFRNRMRAIELLLIDDIQFMCGKERTQEEFFHTFNALHDAKHQIVLTSDKLPQEIPGIEERLQTRFSWGLTADLQAPDFETRVAILKRKASVEDFALPEDVAHLISEKIASNVRELEGALTRLHAVSSLQHVDISMDLARSALKHILQPKSVTISVDDIKKVVAEHFSIKTSDMISKRRTKNLSFPRHIAMYLCRKHTTCSYPEIGGHFGGRDHSSVIHAANVVAAKVGSDDRVRSIVSEIERRLTGI